MANIIFSQPIELYPSHLAAVPTITSATNANSSWPATNLFNYDPYEVYQTTANTTVVTIDYGSAREFQLIALLHSNVTYQAVWTIEVSSNGSSWSTLKASSPFWCNLSAIPGSWSTEDEDPRRGYLGYIHAFYLHGSVQTYRHIRITITDSGAGSGTNWIQVGRLFVGKIFQPGVNYAYGSDIEILDKSERVDMPRGAPLFLRLNKTLQFNITMEFLTQAEMEEYLYELNYWCGNNRELLCCLDPSTVSNRHKRILYGTLGQGLKIAHQSYGIFEQKLTVTGLY